MKRSRHTGEAPSFAGVSLAVYLLVSLLSMMAAYEAGKKSEDVRNSIVHSLQSGQHAPNKSGGDDADQCIVISAGDPVFFQSKPHLERAPDDHFRLPSVVRGFSARAPPVSAPPIV